MKSAFALSTLALTSLVSAAPVKRDEEKSVKFGVVTIHSGSQFQYNSIKKVPSHVHVFSVGGTDGSDVTLTLKPDGTLVDQDGRGIYVNPETGDFGNVDPWGIQKASTGFSIKNNNLVYNNQGNWKACPSGVDKYSLANNDCVGGTGVSLYVVNPTEV